MDLIIKRKGLVNGIRFEIKDTNTVRIWKPDELSFVEVFMGKYGRVESKNGFNIELANYKDISATDFADKYIDYLVNELPKSLEESDTDLFNIRDEMLAQLNKLKYLLTLS